MQTTPCRFASRLLGLGLGLRVAGLLPGAASSQAAPEPPPKMNVVFILADDLGWTDLGCYGSDLYETPNLDRLAHDGMKFTQFYAACCVCSPTRGAIMTGKYPARTHITDWIPGTMPDNPKLMVPDWTKYLPLEETTIADVFHRAGYATAAIGKWHLGDEPYYPEHHGFDLNIGGNSAPAVTSYFEPWWPKRPKDFAPNLAGQPGEYMTNRLGEEAVKFIERSKDKPFFLYLAHYAVHVPTSGPPDLVEKYRQKLKRLQAEGHDVLRHTNPEYAAMVERLDDTVGWVRSALQRLHLADRTIIVFTSDNGGQIGGHTVNLPLRLGKGSAYEGGVREPMIVYWPDVTKPGSVSDVPGIATDFFPTLVEAAGLPAEAARTAVDGVSLVPLLRGTGGIARDAIFWHYPHYQHYHINGATPYSAIRVGDYKLIEFFNDMKQMKVELYNLREDLGEQNNLASAQFPKVAKSHAAKVAELIARLHAWRQEVGAQMPTPNPRYDPNRPEFTPGGRPLEKAADTRSD